MRIIETFQLRGKQLSINCEARVTAHEAGRVTEREREREMDGYMESNVMVCKPLFHVIAE